MVYRTIQLKDNTYKRYTKPELKYIKENMYTLTPAKLAENLGRSASAIGNLVSRLKKQDTPKTPTKSKATPLQCVKVTLTLPESKANSLINHAISKRYPITIQILYS